MVQYYCMNQNERITPTSSLDTQPEIQFSNLTEREYSNKEIIDLHKKLIKFLELMKSAFEMAEQAFLDIETEHKSYLAKFTGSGGNQALPEYSYIDKVRGMRSEILMAIMNIGSAVIEIGSATQSILQVNDPDMSLFEPFALGQIVLEGLYERGAQFTQMDDAIVRKNNQLHNSFTTFLEENEELRRFVKFSRTQQPEQAFLKNTWWLLRVVRNSITHLRQAPPRVALWAFGKHYFPHLHQSTIAMLKDDAQKAALWDDQLEEGSLIVHQTEPDNGVILDYLSLSLASTIAKLKQETLSKQRAKSLSNSEKNAFNGTEHK